MPVYYDSKKIIPAPLCSINKEYVVSGDGTKLGSSFKLSIKGTILPHMGSPTSSGTFWTTSDYPPDEVNSSDEKMKSLIHKQEALRELFSEDGRSFEIQPWDGSQPIKCRPRVVGISFPEGQWFSTCEYTIELEADRIEGYLIGDEDNFLPYIKEAQENWQMEFQDQPESLEQQATFRLTHSVNAVGKRAWANDGTLAMPAWQQARNWVQPRLGIDVDRITASGVLNLPSYMQGYNHARTETVDELGGNYGVTETWLIASGAALEEFDVEIKTGIETGLTNVSIKGTVTGLETRDNNFQLLTHKFDNAEAKFATIEPYIFTRAQTYAGTTLNTEFLNKTVGKNPISGVITYNLDYDDRPSMCLSGVVENLKYETINVTDNNATDIFAALFALGREAGPILQGFETVSEKKREVSVELVVKPQSCYADKPGIDAFIEGFKPDASCIYKHLDTDQWSPTTGKFTKNIGWTYT